MRCEVSWRTAKYSPPFEGGWYINHPIITASSKTMSGHALLPEGNLWASYERMNRDQSDFWYAVADGYIWILLGSIKEWLECSDLSPLANAANEQSHYPVWGEPRSFSSVMVYKFVFEASYRCYLWNSNGQYKLLFIKEMKPIWHKDQTSKGRSFQLASCQPPLSAQRTVRRPNAC